MKRESETRHETIITDDDDILRSVFWPLYKRVSIG